MTTDHDCEGSVALSSITGTHCDEFGLFGDTNEVPDLQPSVLCGRIEEIRVLNDSFTRVLETKLPAVVAVHGVSGSGKTSLVDSLREKVLSHGGYFCAGKFFQNSELQEPYSAILAAYSDLCDLIVQSQDFNDDRRRQIRRKLWPDGPMLTRAVSTLSHVIGFGREDDCANHTDQQVFNLESEASFVRFKIACKTFLHAVSSEDHPIVLFIDDIQWMDEGSRQLIEMLLVQQRTSKLTNIMLVLAYRDEEAEKVEPIFQNQKEDSIEVVDIQVSHLDVASVHEMVCCFTETAPNGSNADPLWELSELVAKRSGGNPFHVIAFLGTIHLEGFLTCEAGAGASSPMWSFDLARIQSEIMVSEESADLLQRKIQQLPQELKTVLEVASLVGYRFSEPIVSGVASILFREMGTAYNDGFLSQAIELGFIEATTAAYEQTDITYNFTHNTIQSAFQSMLDEFEAERLHLLVGEAFLSRLGDSLAMYCAAVHLDQVKDYAENPAKRPVLARVNLEASKYCNEKSAFAKAASMLRRGLEVLGSERWSSEQFDLTFELTETLAKAEFVVGNFDAGKAAAREALRRSKSTEMMINSMLVDLELKIAVYPKEIYSTANRALRILKVAKMPRKVLSHHVILKFLKLKRKLGRRSDTEILNLPIMDDQHALAANLILFHVSAYAFYQFDKNMSAYTALVAGELILDFGLSEWSSIAFVFLGIIEMSMNNYNDGRRYENLSMKLIERMKGAQIRALCPTSMMTYTNLSHFRLPLDQLSCRMLEASSVGIEIGDVVYGCMTFTQTLGMMFCHGMNLNELEELMIPKYEFICNLGQEDQLLWLLPTMQLIVNLTTSNETDGVYSLTELTGEFMDEELYEAQIRKTGHPVIVTLFHMLKAILCCYFGCFDTAVNQYKQLSKNGELPPISFSVSCQDFFGALSYLEEYRSSGKRRFLWGLRKYKKGLERSEAAGNPNAPPLATALRTLELSLRRTVEPDVLAQSFSHATTILRENGMVHIEGLLDQRAGAVFASRGCRAEAEHHFNRALEIYHDDWGAIAPYHWLQKTSLEALHELPQPTSVTKERPQPLIVGEFIEYDSAILP